MWIKHVKLIDRTQCQYLSISTDIMSKDFQYVWNKLGQVHFELGLQSNSNGFH